ncbi:hypothetical protein AAC387_Pa12g0907 [Persea americana]
MIASSGFMDIGFSGNQFTWSNNRQRKSYVAARLDRSLTNQAWTFSFPNSLLQHLIRQNSDHNPILLSSRPPIIIAKFFPFKFEKMWIGHAGFEDLVAKEWSIPIYGNPQYILWKKLKSLKITLRSWNREVFGNLKAYISAVEFSILNLQDTIDAVPLDSTNAALRIARSSLQNLRQVEETHWKQKARINWLKEGDMNTSFFHLAAKVRGSRNRIEKIDYKGNNMEDHLLIKEAAVEFLSDIFKSSSGQLDPMLFQVNSGRVSTVQNVILQSLPSNEEIRATIFSLKRSSSPGPDSFFGFFFCNYWDIVGASIIAAVQNFFSSKKIWKASNSFFLLLIPKIAAPSSFGDYRPISLLNFIYKVSSKISASRLSFVLLHLISNHQVAFLKKRKMQDHIALAHELTQKLQKGANGKVFAWISLIKECVSSPKCSVLVNREPTGYFALGCGLRQGDPLSPYLFILAEEILSLNLEKLVRLKKITPIYRAPSSPFICHMLFADDILLFFQAMLSSIKAIKGVLNSYQLAVGQHFNRGKHKVLYGKRLASWKCKMLSFSGKVILVKHVLQSLHIHVLLMLLIPKSICNLMEKWMRNFLFSGGSLQVKRSVINWQTVCLPKLEGGLGFCRLQDLINASMVRLGWAALSSLWAS